MAAGSSFTGRNFNTDSANVANNPIIAADAYREMLAQSDWGGLNVDIDKVGDGLITGITNTTNGVVKRVDIAETAGTREVRFVYQKEITGSPATFGQQIAPVADKNAFLYQSIEIAEVRSPLYAEHSSMEKRDGGNTLNKFGGSAALAQRNVRLWAGWQYDGDHYDAFLRGASSAYLAPAAVGGLEKDIGGVIPLSTTPNTSAVTIAATAGSPCSPENVVAFDGSASGGTVTLQLKSALLADRGAHEDALSNIVYNLQQVTGAANLQANALDRGSVKGMHSLASQMNIRKLNGSNYDYIWKLDWEALDQLIGSFDANSADTRFLIGIWREIAASGKDTEKLMDVRLKDLIIDGVLLQPSRYLQGYRPAVIGGTAPTSGTNTNDAGRVIWTNASGTTPQSSWYGLDKFRAYETNKNKVAVGMFMGDSALLSAVDGGLEMLEDEGKMKTGKVWGSSEWRTVTRSVWRGKDPATVNEIRNEGSILTLSCINGTVGTL